MWAFTGEPLSVPVAIGAGVLIDMDHSPDLWWAYALRREPGNRPARSVLKLLAGRGQPTRSIVSGQGNEGGAAGPDHGNSINQ